MLADASDTSAVFDLASALDECAHSPVDDVEALARAIPAEDQAVEEILAALWRRRDRSSATDAERLRQAADDLQRRYLSARWQRRREAWRTNAMSPLQERMLSALTHEPSSPSTLAQHFGISQEHVVRQLRPMLDEGLVIKTVDPEDARRRLYAPAAPSSPDALADDDQTTLEVSDTGRQHHLSRREFGGTDDASSRSATGGNRSPAREAFDRRVRARLDAAVVARRCAQATSTTARELAELAATAQGAREGTLEVLALRELATTQRQAGLRRQHSATLRTLDAISSGERETMSRWALLAKGHLEYERGKLAAQAGGPQGLRHLLVASSIFSDLGTNYELDDVSRWLAWSTYATGDWLRRRSLVDQALPVAGRSTARFVEIGDEYGVANALVLVGFCLRARGDFAAAETVLGHASGYAEERRYVRAQADALTQLGEARRARGEYDGAHDALMRAVGLARETHHVTAEAFCRSSLGAWAFDTRQFDLAVNHFSDAYDLFHRQNHSLGLALTKRRSAIAALALAEERQDLHASHHAHHQLTQAQRRFGALGLEVGVVTCRIDRSTALLQDDVRGTRVRKAVGTVVDWFKNRGDHESGLNMLRVERAARDPWAPHSLQHLVTRVREFELPQAESLGHVAGHVRDNAHTGVSRWEAELQPVYELTGEPPPMTDVTRVDPMGGEPARIVVADDDDAQLIGLTP